MGTSMPFRKLDLQFVDTDIANIIDPLLVFNYTASGNNTSDSGVIIERGDLTNVGFIWDESTDTFALINTTEDGSTTGNVSISSYANLRADTLTASLTGDVTGDLTGNVTGNVTGNITSSGTSTFTTIDVNGGAIDGTAIGANSASTGAFTTLSSSGNLTVGGNLTVSGTTKTVNSTVVQVADPIMTVGGTSSPSSDDNKDRGIAFRWHDGTSAKIGFFGFDDSTGKFTFVPDGSLSSEVVSGTAGDVEFGAVTATSYSGDGSNLTGVSSELVDDTSPQLGGDMDANGFRIQFSQTNYQNGEALVFKNSADNSIYGTILSRQNILDDFYIANHEGSIRLVNHEADKDIVLSTDDGTGSTATYLLCDGSSGEVKLYHYGSEKFATKSDGIDVTGNVALDGELNITSTYDTSSAGPIINLKRDSSSPANADYLGQIKWKGENSTGGEVNYAKITGKILDVTNGSEDGILEFAFIKNGSQNISGRFRSDSLQLLNGTNLHIGDEGDITFEGSTDDSYETTLTVVDPTADRTLSLPNQTGTLAITSDIPGSSSDVQFDSFGVGTAASGTTGEIRATNDVTAYYSSDERLKENIVEIDNALEKVKQIRGVRYDWTDEHIKSKGGPDNYFMRKTDVGVIAQEIEAVLPEIVAERDDGIKAVRYERLTALLIEAVKELSARVDELEKKQ